MRPISVDLVFYTDVDYLNISTKSLSDQGTSARTSVIFPVMSSVSPGDTK